MSGREYTDNINKSKGRSGTSNAMYGRTHTKETKVKIGLIHKGKSLSLNHRKILSEYHKGKKKTSLHRINISNATKGINHHHSKKWYINGKLFFSSKEAGDYFDVSTTTIQRWCKYNIPLCYSL